MDLGMTILMWLAGAVATAALGLSFRWVDRLVTARVQWRVGPPWYQPGADILKLMGKETLMPSTARGTGFLLAPLVAVAASTVTAAILWRALLRPESTFLGDLVVVLYLLTIPAIMTIAGAAASGSPHASLGAAREIKLLLSYELPMVIAMMTAVAHTGWSLRLGGILQAQANSPVILSISGGLAMVVAVLCMQAKLGLVPFDMAEAECEIMSGVYVEYSGPLLAMFMISNAMMLALMPLLLIIVFWGGLNTGAWWGWLTLAGKYVLLVALATLIRNTNPRLRIDQAMRFFWFYVTPLAIAAAVLAIVGAARAITWL